MAIPAGFRGKARRLDNIDLPRAGRLIGVGEDEIHALLDVESRGTGFDGQGRPLILFEPHIFWRELGPGAKRTRASAKGLAYLSWGSKPYPRDSYPVLAEAMAIDETAALRSASWGLGQILGLNHAAAGYATVQDMVAAFCDDEKAHLFAMVRFLIKSGLDDELRRHDWVGLARGYNGPSFARNSYDKRLAAAYAKWSKIKDTPWSPASAAEETRAHDVAPHVTGLPPSPRPAAPTGDKAPAGRVPAQAPASAPPVGFWQWLATFISSLRGGHA